MKVWVIQFIKDAVIYYQAYLDEQAAIKQAESFDDAGEYSEVLELTVDKGSYTEH